MGGDVEDGESSQTDSNRLATEEGVYHDSGVDRTDEIPAVRDAFINVLTITDLQKLARSPSRCHVVAIATGLKKTRALRVALETRIANVVITTKDMALRLLE